MHLLFLLLFVSSQSFASLKVEDVYRSALNASEIVQQSEESRVQSTEQRKQAWGTFLPSVNFLGVIYRQDPPRTSLGSSISPSMQRTYRLNARQFLFQGGAEYAFAKVTKKTELASIEQVRDSRRILWQQVVELFYNNLLQKRELEHLEKEQALYQDQIKEISSRTKIGRSRVSELYTVKAAGAATDARRYSLETGFEDARMQLQSLAKLPQTFELKSENLKTPPKSKIKSLDTYLALIEERPDIKAARLNLEAMESNIWVSRAGHLPLFDVTGNYYFKRPGINATSEWDASLNVTFPIFAGGVTQSKIREASSQMRVATLELDRIRRLARDEIMTLYRSVKNTDQELQDLELSRKLSEQSWSRTRKDNRLGLSTNLDTIQALKNYVDAERAYDRAYFKRKIDRAKLDAAVAQWPGSKYSPEIED